ncbi:MAG: hypothetical protein BGP06_08525 [Rhizobiales bacterium 65-9]|nr:MAG: hypothetical protein BGP06_08525 [Rhizobiales bacterium 65-9]
MFAAITTMRGTPYAIAQGETRTLTFIHNHTKEQATITFKRWGSYDSSALDQLNWLCRDWRRDEKTRMNPRLFDVLWEAEREVGSSSPIYINSAYRSPSTNAALRRRSRAVAKHSQHMEGNAMDFYLADVSMTRVREVAMRMQRGGVGYYPTANTPFVHLDVGSVRSWPRMTRDQLARLFPDGKTVHLPAGGGAMEGYEEAKAMILARGGSVGGYSGDEETEGFGGGASFFAALFGGGSGGGGGRPSTVGDDAGVRSVALGNVRAGESVVASAADMTSSPRSLRGRRGRAAETQVASAAPAPVPVAAPAPAAPASNPIFNLFGGSRAPQAPAQTQAPIQTASLPAQESQPQPRTVPALVSAPMPPQRPPELAAAAPVVASADIPMPPLRPAELIPTVVASAQPARAEDALGAIIRRSSPGETPKPATPTQLVAYAPVEAPLPPARPGIRATTVVVASAGSLGARPATVPTSRTRTLGAPVAGKAALAPVDAILMEFRRKADIGPSAGQFSGPAVKPIALSSLKR